jgi:hypothetical protein
MGDAYLGHQTMISRKTIALSVAALVVSAPAAMAATTHHRYETSVQRTYNAEARASFAAAPGARYLAGPYYYGGDDNGSVWAFYPGYVPTARY